MTYFRETLLLVLLCIGLALCGIMALTGHPNPLTFPPLVLNLLRVDVLLLFVVIASKWFWK